MRKLVAKYIECKLTFASPCLGDAWVGQNNKTPEYRFFRDDAGCIVLKHRHLFAMLTKAKNSINSPVDIRKVDFFPTVSAETVIVQPEIPGASTYEGIGTGETVYLTFGVEQDVTLDQFKALMKEAGIHIGLSPAFSVQGFGRFEVDEVKEEVCKQPYEMDAQIAHQKATAQYALVPQEWSPSDGATASL